MSKASSADRFKLINTFQALRKTILQKESSGDLEKPLAYWALPGDRRLPLAFLGRSLKDLMNVSFDDLAATPGIGQKKIGSLIRLLARGEETSSPRLTARSRDRRRSSSDWRSQSCRQHRVQSSKSFPSRNGSNGAKPSAATD